MAAGIYFKKAWTHLENRIYESISFFTKVKKHAQTKDRDNEEEHESVPKLNIFCNVLSDFAGERKFSERDRKREPNGMLDRRTDATVCWKVK